MAHRPIEAVLEEHAKELMQIPGVVGVGIGACDDAACIRVMASGDVEAVRKNVPGEIEGYKTDVVWTGGFKALPDE